MQVPYFVFQNALTDPHRVRTPAITEYWKPLAEDVSTTTGFLKFELIPSFFPVSSYV